MLGKFEYLYLQEPSEKNSINFIITLWRRDLSPDDLISELVQLSFWFIIEYEYSKIIHWDSLPKGTQRGHN